MESMTYGTLPERSAFLAKVEPQIPDGYPMVIRCPDEWAAICEVINRGIDSHLEAVATTEADPSTGRICIADAASLYTFIRRACENPPDCECTGDSWETAECSNESYDGEHCNVSRIQGLCSSIMQTLDYEWI